MKTALSISFIAIVVIVMLLGLYETAYAGDIGQCYNKCFPGGVCVSDPDIECNLRFYCNGWHYYEDVNCEIYYIEFCCAEGCPC
jgi:hypothetical protein